ncbi:MAG: hypothetical protein KC420_11345, partial [Myxococcales bacterium]|nr:hypothetical protein [Myxococcales bacterium]
YEFPEDMNGFEDEDGTPEPLEEDGRGGLDRLAAPKVTASAMSVVIPAAGEAVLYQHLLLAAESAYAIEIAAREPLLQKRRRRRR